MKVLSVAFQHAPVGLAAVGGAEQVLAELDRALVARGHTSVVVACAGSETAGQCITWQPLDGVRDTAQNRERFQEAINRALDLHAFDLIHLHGMDFFRYRWPEELTALVTLHLPVAWYPPETWRSLGPRVHLQCVSEAQRLSCPAEMGEVHVVANGVAMPCRQPAIARENFALMLGRVCEEKNFHAALDAGTRCGLPVYLGGQVFPYPSHESYFQREIEPRLARGDGHRFLGPLGPAEKWDLLGRAYCLLHPTLAPETSSLVAMEAIAAGTPVVAYRSGALVDLVEDGVTGYLVNSVEAMVEAIHRVASIDRERCSAIGAARFSLDRMVDGYLSLYERLRSRRARETRCA